MTFTGTCFHLLLKNITCKSSSREPPSVRRDWHQGAVRAGSVRRPAGTAAWEVSAGRAAAEPGRLRCVWKARGRWAWGGVGGRRGRGGSCSSPGERPLRAGMGEGRRGGPQAARCGHGCEVRAERSQENGSRRDRRIAAELTLGRVETSCRWKWSESVRRRRPEAKSTGGLRGGGAAPGMQRELESNCKPVAGACGFWGRRGQ